MFLCLENKQSLSSALQECLELALCHGVRSTLGRLKSHTSFLLAGSSVWGQQLAKQLHNIWDQILDIYSPICCLQAGIQFFWRLSIDLVWFLCSPPAKSFQLPKLRLQLAWSERAAHCFWEGDAWSDQACPLTPVFDCNWGLSRSGICSFSPELLTHVLSMSLSCLVYNDRGRTEAVVERK